MDPHGAPHVTIGEAMVVLYPEGHRPLAEAEAFGSDVGGAELNVATSLARLGVPTAWLSRLGDDGFGERIRNAAAEYGVDASAVERDATRPTGLYVKESTLGPSGHTTRMHYYRRDSAASAIGFETFATGPAAALLQSAALVHTSGITAALSPSVASAIARLREVVGPETVVSVDLNFRLRLWQDRDTAALDALVDRADLLFAGHDEAEAHFGHADPERFFAGNPQLTTLVLKDDVRAAAVHRRDGGVSTVPCLTVDVVEPVGAGDAFAAGFLCGRAEGRDDIASLRLGHALASLALIAHGDRPVTVPSRAERDRIAAASDDEWSRWRVHAGALPWRDAEAVA
ncbi:MAG: sugar kinase [Leifsonia sp.]